MAQRSYEMIFKIGGSVASSLQTSFNRARGNVDDLQDAVRDARRELSQLNRDFRAGRISQDDFAAGTARVRAEMQRLENAQQRVRALSSGLNKAWDTTKSVASIAAVTTATAAVATTMKSINVAADFEKQMSSVGAKSQATSAEMVALKETALELGASTSLSANQVAVAMDDLAAGGFSVSSIIKALPGIISGAEASGEELSLVANTVSSALSVWGLEAGQAAKVSDVLAQAANVSSASVEDFGYAFKYAGPPAAALNHSLESVAAATAIMTNNGLDGSSAGTSLRASLLKLNNPAKAQQKIMNSLGFTMKDASGEAKSLSNIIRDLEKATKGMTEAEKVATIGKLVGTEAVSGFLTLIKTGPDAIDEMTKAFENSAGSSAIASKKMMDNYAGAKEKMMGAFETAQIAFATPMLPILQDAFTGVAEFVDENMEGIESMGEKIAAGLGKVLDPFSMEKPELTLTVMKDPEAFAAYQEELAKFKAYEEMDFSDKVIASLDTVVEGAEEWLDGGGGEALEEVFSKMGEIAVNAWIGALGATASGAVDNALEGNFASAAAMGGAAWLLGGGAIMKTAGKLGKTGYNKYKARTATPTAPVTPPVTTTPTASTTRTVPTATAATPVSTTVNTMGPRATGTITPRTLGPTVTGEIANRVSTAAPTSVAAQAGTVTTATSAVSKWNQVGSVASKSALPIAVLAEGYNVVKSDDKVKATAEGVSGLAGGLGGAKAGAALGTMIAPGIGTAIGGFLGGLFGYGGAKWAAGKTVDGVRGSTATPSAASAGASIARASTTGSSSITTSSSNSNSQNSVAMTTMNTNITKFNTDITNTTTKMIAFADTLPTLQESTTTLNTHMQALIQVTQQAPAWLAAGLFGIKSAGEELQSALRDAAARVRSTNFSPGSQERLSYE